MEIEILLLLNIHRYCNVLVTKHGALNYNWI
jgi:hypothetical protein